MTLYVSSPSARMVLIEIDDLGSEKNARMVFYGVSKDLVRDLKLVASGAMGGVAIHLRRVKETKGA